MAGLLEARRVEALLGTVVYFTLGKLHNAEGISWSLPGDAVK